MSAAAPRHAPSSRLPVATAPPLAPGPRGVRPGAVRRVLRAGRQEAQPPAFLAEPSLRLLAAARQWCRRDTRLLGRSRAASPSAGRLWLAATLQGAGYGLLATRVESIWTGQVLLSLDLSQVQIRYSGESGFSAANLPG